MIKTYENFIKDWLNKPIGFKIPTFKSDKSVKYDDEYIIDLTNELNKQDINLNILVRVNYFEGRPESIEYTLGSLSIKEYCKTFQLLNAIKRHFIITDSEMNKEFNVKNFDVEENLYISLKELKERSDKFIIILKKYINNNIDSNRIDEFEIIKDGKVDWISIESLIEFYEIPKTSFTIDSIKQEVEKLN